MLSIVVVEEVEARTLVSFPIHGGSQEEEARRRKPGEEARTLISFPRHGNSLDPTPNHSTQGS